jgi:hypothetical protein
LNAKEETMTSVLAALGSTGATVVIAQSRPAAADSGWQSVPGTSYYMHALRR